LCCNCSHIAAAASYQQLTEHQRNMTFSATLNIAGQLLQPVVTTEHAKLTTYWQFIYASPAYVGGSLATT
jgi:hypothetical protein